MRYEAIAIVELELRASPNLAAFTRLNVPVGAMLFVYEQRHYSPVSGNWQHIEFEGTHGYAREKEIQEQTQRRD